jgi:hypothetical protein
MTFDPSKQYTPEWTPFTIQQASDPNPPGPMIKIKYENVLVDRVYSGFLADLAELVEVKKNPFVWMRVIFAEGEYIDYRVVCVDHAKQILKTFLCFCADFPTEPIPVFGVIVDVKASYEFMPAVKKQKMNTENEQKYEQAAEDD